MKFFYYIDANVGDNPQWLAWRELKEEEKKNGRGQIPVMIRFDKKKILIVLKSCISIDKWSSELERKGAERNIKELKKYKDYRIIERKFEEIDNYTKGRTCSLKEIMVDEL